MVRTERLELSRQSHQILSLACLPIPPRPRIITTNFPRVYTTFLYNQAKNNPVQHFALRRLKLCPFGKMKTFKQFGNIHRLLSFALDSLYVKRLAATHGNNKCCIAFQNLAGCATTVNRRRLINLKPFALINKISRRIRGERPYFVAQRFRFMVKIKSAFRENANFAC